jgi:predicted transcriptional regulator
LKCAGKVYCAVRILFETSPLSDSHLLYRDKIYIIKDVILKLVEYGELTQTTLISFCGLNMKKHKHILNYLEAKSLITTEIRTIGKRVFTIYKPTGSGIEFCKTVLEPYENMFPRKLRI